MTFESTKVPEQLPTDQLIALSSAVIALDEVLSFLALDHPAYGLLIDARRTVMDVYNATYQIK